MTEYEAPSLVCQGHLGDRTGGLELSGTIRTFGVAGPLPRKDLPSTANATTGRLFCPNGKRGGILALRPLKVNTHLPFKLRTDRHGQRAAGAPTV